MEHLLKELTPWWNLIGPAVVGLTVFLAGFMLRAILIGRLTQWATKGHGVWRNLIVEAIRGPFILWCLMAALYAAMIASPLALDLVALGGRALSILWIISLTVATLRLADQMIQRYGERLSVALPLTSLTQNLAKGTILVVGGLIILNSFGISITPLLTALGVGGLAVALALQDTLSNLFSGFYITLARQIRVGDYIQLDSSQEGYVLDIAWRSARVRTLSNNLIVIPNVKLGQAIVTNFSLPSPAMAVLIEMGVSYDSDLEKVERVTLQVAKDVVQQVKGGVPSFEPLIRYHTFRESSIQFTVVLQGKDFEDQFLLKHEFIKRIHRRYEEEGITIPFPTRTVFVKSPTSGLTTPP